MAKLSALFGLDAFAGGFVVQSIVAYWFHVRWGLSPATLGVVFFWVGVLSGLSLLAAGWLAERVGLLNTMVFTHLPASGTGALCGGRPAHGRDRSSDLIEVPTELATLDEDLGLRRGEVRFGDGETVRTQISAKFTPEMVERSFAEAQLQLRAWLTEPIERFALALASWSG